MNECCQQKLTWRTWSGQKEEGADHTSCQLPRKPSCWNPSWLSDASATRKDPESEWLARDNPETNAITITPKTASQTSEQFSWVPLSCCFPPGHSLPIESFAFSAHISPWIVNFWLFDKSPLVGPWKGVSPSCNPRTMQLWKRMTCALYPNREEFQVIQDSY